LQDGSGSNLLSTLFIIPTESKTVKSTEIKPYKFKRLSHDKVFWRIWKQGPPQPTRTIRSLYKLASAMRWARFTLTEVLYMLKCWHGSHDLSANEAQLQLIVAAVEEWIKPKMQRRKREEMRRYRAKKAEALVVSHE
jgi:hypothetical protein